MVEAAPSICLKEGAAVLFFCEEFVMRLTLRHLIFLFLVFVVAGSSPAQESEEALFNDAAAALGRAEYGRAEAEFCRVLAMDPRSLPAIGNLGVIYLRTHRFAQAIASYQEGLLLDPENEGLLLNLGLAYLKQEDYVAAQPVFAKLHAQRSKEDRFTTLLATSMIFGKAPQEGLALLNGMEASGGDSSLLYLKAVGYARAGQVFEGQKIFAQLLNSRETHAQASFLVGQAYYDGRRYEDAEGAYREVLAGEPTFKGVHRELGKVYVSMRRNEEAAAELKLALKQDPEDSGADYFLGALLVQNGKYAEGVPYLERAQKLLPDSWAAPFYLGKARLNLEQPSAALPLLQQAATLNGDEPSVFYLLAKAARATGHSEEAKKALQRVIDLRSTALEAERQATLQREVVGAR